MRLVIEIDLEHAPFDCDPGGELAKVLRVAAQLVEGMSRYELRRLEHEPLSHGTVSVGAMRVE